MATGHFVYNIDGEVGHGVGFYPSARDIETYFRSRHVPDNPLPGRILDAVPDGERSWVVTGGGGLALPPQVNMRSQAEQDGRKLDGRIQQVSSLNAAGLLLSDDVTERPSGQFLQERLRPALEWRARQLGCEHARRLLMRYQS